MHLRFVRTALILGTSSVWGLSASAQAPKALFGHVLSDFNGPVRTGIARMALDPKSREVLVAEGRDVRVFNDAGMQAFGFRTGFTRGAILDLAVEPSGEILTLTPDLEAPGDRPRIFITRHDFRGVPLREIELSGLPAGFEGFLPNRVRIADGRLVLANTSTWLVAVADADGAFERGYDIAEILKIPEDERSAKNITGFNVDAEGSLLLTCSVMFRAFVISAKGEVVGEWGTPGSVPGTFGVVAGIARDRAGRTYVVDKNRGVVMVFDRSYQFLMEFGGDPTQEGGALRVPDDVLLDGESRIYVTQLARRGVVAYELRLQ